MRRWTIVVPVFIVVVPLLIALACGFFPEVSDATRLTHQVKAAQADRGPEPRAVIRERIHQFGTLDPLTTGTHRFVIRNEGDAPLELSGGQTTCKCTLSEIQRRTVPPGESTEVKLTWNTRAGQSGLCAAGHDPHQRSETQDDRPGNQRAGPRANPGGSRRVGAARRRAGSARVGVHGDLLAGLGGVLRRADRGVDRRRHVHRRAGGAGGADAP